MLNSTNNGGQRKSPSIRDRVQTMIERISYITSIVSMVTIVLMMVLTVFDVILRKIGGAVMGMVEISELMLVVVAYFSFAYCLVRGRHIEIDVLTQHLSSRWKSASLAFGEFVGLAFFGTMLFGSVGFAIEAYEMAETTSILRIPLFPVKLLLVIGTLIFCVQILAYFIKHLRQTVKGG